MKVAPIDYPPPLRHSLQLIGEQANDASRHDQCLFAFASVLRLVTSVLLARYLRQSGDDPDINRCLITNFRKPALGHHVDFMRCCVNSRIIDWGPVGGLVIDVKALVSGKGQSALSALLRARNRWAHGATVTHPAKATGLLTEVNGWLEEVLSLLPTLRQLSVTDGPPLELSIGEVTIAWIPVADPVDGSRIGILEGWEERRGRLNYIGSESAWQSDAGWREWVILLQQRGLLPVDPDQITMLWIESRARAMLPVQCQGPEEREVVDQLCDAAGRFEGQSEVPAKDPFLAALAFRLLGHRRGRIVFVVLGGQCGFDGDVVASFSETIGVRRPLDEVPGGHPVEMVLAQVDVVLLLPSLVERKRWAGAISLFVGMTLRVITPGMGAVAAFRGLDDFAEGFLRFWLERLGTGQTSVPETVLQWANNIGRIHALAEIAARDSSLPDSPFAYWLLLIGDALPEAERSAALSVDGASSGDWDSAQSHVLERLHVVGALSLDARGRWGWSDRWAKWAALTWSVRAGLPERLVVRRLHDAEFPPDDSTARGMILVLKARSEVLSFHPVTQIWAGAVAAISPGGNQRSDIDRWATGLTDPLTVVRGASLLLMSWGRPDCVRLLLERLQPTPGTDDQLLLELAGIARRSGDFGTAARLFGLVGNSSDGLVVRARHELAGVLRDQGTAHSRREAARLYEELLVRGDMLPEQRVRSLCGAAENLTWLGRTDEAARLLEEASGLVAGEEPILQALVHHRCGFLALHGGRPDVAVEACLEAVGILSKPWSGPFASRVLDTLALALQGCGRDPEAEAILAESLAIKRSIGDRLGLQKGLWQLSTLLQHVGRGDADIPALEALRLAEAAGDLQGQAFAHRRLTVIYRRGDPRRDDHHWRLAELSVSIGNASPP
jgi:hypothetical protein